MRVLYGAVCCERACVVVLQGREEGVCCERVRKEGRMVSVCVVVCRKEGRGCM